jgi:hypothetical protein
VSRSNPVLCRSECAWLTLFASHPAQQDRVNLTDQPKTDWETLEKVETFSHRIDVVFNFLHIIRSPCTTGHRLKYLREGRLRPFNPRTGKRLSRQVGLDQQVWIWQQALGSGQPSEGVVRLGQQQHCLSVEP